MKPAPWMILSAALVLGGCLPRPAAPAALGPAQPEAPLSRNLGQVQDFTLQDPQRQSFRFFENTQAYTLMSFAFTHCSDVCPYVLLKMQAAWDLLGPSSAKVRLVAVTVDPERDTPEVLKAYLTDLGLSGRVQFLTGELSQLEKVWKDFGVTVKKTEGHHEAEETAKNAQALGMHMPENPEVRVQKGLSKEIIAMADRAVVKYAGGYDVTHSSPFWLVSPQGKILALMDYDRTPRQLADEILSRLP